MPSIYVNVRAVIHSFTLLYRTPLNESAATHAFYSLWVFGLFALGAVVSNPALSILVMSGLPDADASTPSNRGGGGEQVQLDEAMAGPDSILPWGWLSTGPLPFHVQTFMESLCKVQSFRNEPDPASVFQGLQVRWERARVYIRFWATLREGALLVSPGHSPWFWTVDLLPELESSGFAR